MDEHEYFFGLEGPLDAIPASGQMRAANLTGFSDYARIRGSDAHRILERHGLEPRTLVDPDSHIGCQQVVDVFEYCSTLFDDPLFGLRLAHLQDPDVFGCVTALCRAAPDLRSAVGCLVDYIPIVHSPEADLELVEGLDTAELRWNVRTDMGVNDQANYQALMLMLKLLRTVGGNSFKPAYVHLAVDARPRDVPEIEGLVACHVLNRAERNAIGFPVQALDQPIASANRLIFRLLGGYLARVKLVNRANIVERTASYVRGALPAGTCSIERCAEKLGLSVRTLQARLAVHDISFSDLVEAQRENLARIYLKQTRMPLDEVAERLGYGEQTSFGRAFKRWTGTTPRKFRAVGGSSNG
ncbi:AraC family transcriptional regulator [Sphingomonas cavernae]|uniref:Helix-turn-helix domain-containing protein n=1 Tax=Sphingomonas cavernae TaxID=2320861 RepID=A0A418WNM1_9SPHN|nr:AraC family transcriptional regulator [Sphingomonas cavernae]RJF91602.1 helix-turn-helix domain-containing protein [Sphingomonas cavernae]